MRVAVIGRGAMARVHAAVWTGLGHDVLIASNGDTAPLADEIGASAVDGIEAAIELADLADVCSPTSAHADHCILALRAGVDVVCEKPLALTVEDALRVEAAADAAGRRVFPAHVVRYFPQYSIAKETIASGGLGDLAVLRFHRSGRRPDGEWFSDPNRSGGPIVDLMVHDIDQAIWIAGPVTRVTATITEVAAADGALVSTALATLTHAGGPISLCQATWGAPGREFRFGFDHAGTGGVLAYDSREHTGFRLTSDRGADAPASHLPELGFIDDPYREQLADIARAVETGGPTRTSIADGVAAVRIAEAARVAAASGETVEIAGGIR